MRRRTKIVATLGPASTAPETLRAMLLAGVDVLRINFSHPQPQLSETVQLARQLAAELNQPLAIMADLQGPKIRIGQFKHGAVELRPQQSFVLHCAPEQQVLGDEHGVSVSYPALCRELVEGDHLLLDDGLIELVVIHIQDTRITCTVLDGGILRDLKGLNRKGGGLTAGSLTSKDCQDMALAVGAGVDYMTLSFVKDAADIVQTRQRLAELGAPSLPIIAKIERAEALNQLTGIIVEADAVMVARGDLGVEIGPAEVPAYQKLIIKQARNLNKMVITATQMMESMTHHPQPTRAEVSDVANAILDGTDAVMLSAETASGSYPVKVITMVDRICRSAEKHAAFSYQNDHSICHYQRADQSIAMATMHVANRFPVQAIFALTESGATAIWMSRMPSTVPVYAITGNESTVRKLSLANNVFPLYLNYSTVAEEELTQAIVDFGLRNQLIETGHFILLTRGAAIGVPSGTDRMELVKVG